MSQTLLFSIGVGVFAITVVASLLYGYFTLDRIYQAEAAERPVISASTTPTVPDITRSHSFPTASPAPVAASLAAWETERPV